MLVLEKHSSHLGNVFKHFMNIEMIQRIADCWIHCRRMNNTELKFNNKTQRIIVYDLPTPAIN